MLFAHKKPRRDRRGSVDEKKSIGDAELSDYRPLIAFARLEGVLRIPMALEFLIILRRLRHNDVRTV